MPHQAINFKVLLDNLGEDHDKKLECCAHIILCVDHSRDKIYKDTEQNSGIQKLLLITLVRKPSIPLELLFIGLIAVAKLLSPSHATHFHYTMIIDSRWKETMFNMRNSKALYQTDLDVS